MEFRIRGSFEVVGSEGPVDLRGAKRRGLVACLVVHAGQPMTTDRLTEELWADGGTEGAARTLQTCTCGITSTSVRPRSRCTWPATTT